MKNSKRKTSPHVSSTVLFKFTEKEHREINQPFRDSFQILKSGKGTQTDWFNATFRVLSAYLIAKKTHEDVTIEQLKNVLDICEGLELRARDHQHTKWEVTSEEIEWIEAGLDAIEELQRTINRKIFYECCTEADTYIRKKYAPKGKLRNTNKT